MLCTLKGIFFTTSDEPPETATFRNLGEFNSTGPNYNPIFDGLVWATGTGMIYGVDRKTGIQNIHSDGTDPSKEIVKTMESIVSRLN